jgi:Tol biopolymer transport system component
MLMKNAKRLTLTCFVLLLLALLALPDTIISQERPQTGPYFGQVAPGMEPEIFAPGLVSTSEGEGCIVFSADGRRVVFRRFGTANLLLEGEDTADGWRIFRVAPPFSRLDWYNGDFVLAPDGTSFYFTSLRPIGGGSTPPARSKIWMVEWDEGDWSTPNLVLPHIQSFDHQAYPTLTADGTLYFFSRRASEGNTNYIYRSIQANGEYAVPERLSYRINTGHHEYDPFVAPDGSYLIFASNKPGGFGGGDFYVSFRDASGSWSDPVNMGEGINSSANENRPFLTLDGRYFFFTSDREVSHPALDDVNPGDRPGNGSRDVYWVDAAVIERLKPER